MTEPVLVKVTDPKHANALSEWYGLLRAQQALSEQKFDKLPGYALAAAIVDREAAEAKSRVMADNIRACVKAGVDVAQSKSVSLEFVKGVPTLQVEMMDLADMGEASDD